VKSKREADLYQLVLPKVSLNSAVWESNKLNPDVRDALLRIANEFYIFLGVNTPIGDITLTGSLANYNWTDLSDIDLHLLLDYDLIDENKEFVKEFLFAKKSLWNDTHDIRVKGHEVELYAQDLDEVHHSSGVYSVLTNEWLQRPAKMTKSIDIQEVKQKTKALMRQIDHVLHSPSRLRLIDKMKDKLKKFRQSGLERSGELSIENLVFKTLRRNGYLEKLYMTGLKDFDKSLSLQQENMKNK
tara:strand:- start:2439 stop:3167 length:729 start_codon:yes stop_codon:yes gene_type:complete